MRFRVTIVQPPGYPHAQAFAEVAETLVIALRRLGHQAVFAYNHLSRDEVNIVLGIHLVPPAVLARLPVATIAYNLEQVERELFRKYPLLLDIYQDFEVWDYSLANMARLRAYGLGARLRHLPIGMVPELTRIAPAPVQDIDVLFYGSLDERRRAVLDQLSRGGLEVTAVFGAYGAERDALIARAKLVLNVHKHEAQVFEVVRVSYLLANHKAVVAEIDGATEIEDDLRDAVAGMPYDQLVDGCRALLADDGARHALERRGFERMSGRDAAAALARVLAEREA